METVTPNLVTVPDVEILHAGIEYNLSTGKTTFTMEDLRDVVMAANEDNSIPQPRLKLGHIDPRFNDTSVFDATPSFGKATNLRLSPNGTTVLADYQGVPKWLADIMPTAFPSRSIEGHWNVQSAMGKQWRFVLSACSLLGVEWPGVSVLEDLPQYYGEDMPADVVVDPSLFGVAASNQPGGDPVKWPRKGGAAASANLDDVRRTFYTEYVPEHASDGAQWWWIQAVLTDPNELVVEDDESGQLYKLSFASDDNGTVSFGDAQPVRIDYLPDDRETQKAAASMVAATLAIGRTVLASYSTRAESRPATTGGAMDPTEVRKALSLPEDASDEQVHEALLAKAGLVAGTTEEPPAPAEAPAPVATVTPLPVAAPAVVPVEAPAVAEPIAASSGFTLPEGTVLMDKGTLDAIRASVNTSTEFINEQRARDRAALVTAAIGDGRIPPASKDHWLKMLEVDPNAPATLAGLAPGVIPVQERGHGQPMGHENGDTPQLDAEIVNGWSESMFPEIRAAHSRDRALANGEHVARTRIVTDAHFVR